MKKSLFLTAALLVGASLSLYAITGEEIAQKSKDTTKAKSTQIQASMIVTSKDGTTSERMVEQYGVVDKGLSKAVIVFKKPANVADTRFLVLENEGRAEDRWIYLPKLGKVRRVSSGEGSGSFVGTDFTYDDISAAGREVSKDNHKLLREEAMAGSDCYVLESSPKTPGDGQYSRTVRWIAKNSWLTLRVEMYDKENTLLKLLEVSKHENKQGYWTPIVTKMSNVQEKTSTSMEIKQVIYDKAIPASVFTENFLKTGRP